MESGAKGHSQEVGRGDRPAGRPGTNVYMYHLYPPGRKNRAVAPGNPVETDTRRQQPSNTKQRETSVETMDYSLTPFGGSAGSHMYGTDSPRRRLEPIEEERSDPLTRGILGRVIGMIAGKPNHTPVAVEGDENILIGGDNNVSSQSHCNNRGRNSVSLTLDFNPSHFQVGTFVTLNNHHNTQSMMTKNEHRDEIELHQIKLESSEELKPPGDLVGPKTEPNAGGQALETPAPTSPLRPIKAEEHYLRRQLSQSHRAITEDISLLMAEGDKYWYGLKCCTTIIVTILIAILLLVILRWVLYK